MSKTVLRVLMSCAALASRVGARLESGTMWAATSPKAPAQRAAATPAPPVNPPSAFRPVVNQILRRLPQRASPDGRPRSRQDQPREPRWQRTDLGESRAEAAYGCDASSGPTSAGEGRGTTGSPLLSRLRLDRGGGRWPNPGRPAVHRLNRAEYTNAIRDLLALTSMRRSMLPADDSAYGFDNIADLLTVSPGLLERYMSAASKISRLAIGGLSTGRSPKPTRCPSSRCRTTA